MWEKASSNINTAPTPYTAQAVDWNDDYQTIQGQSSSLRTWGKWETRRFTRKSPLAYPARA